MKKQRILVADDEEGIRESLNLILGDAYELIYAKDGRETLEALRKNHFALALLDIKMPKLDGMDVLRAARAAGKTTPVVVLTAYSSVEMAKEAVRIGARDYILKPFERSKILTAVRDALSQQ